MSGHMSASHAMRTPLLRLSLLLLFVCNTITLVLPPSEAALAVSHSSAGVPPSIPWQPGLIIFDGSPIVSFSAYRPVVMRMRASQKVFLVTYALWKLDRTTFQADADQYQGLPLPQSAPLRSWIAQPQSTTFQTTVTDNRGALLPPGLYLFMATVTGGGTAPQLFVVTHTALTLKRSSGQLFLWATDLKTGQPVAEARVDVERSPVSRPICFGGCGTPTLPAAPRHVASGVTATDGTASLSLPSSVDPWATLYAYISGPHGDLSVASTAWSANFQFDPSLPTSFGNSTQTWRAFVQSDRPIYRPGQIIHLRAVVRVDNDGTYRQPSTGTPIVVTVNDPQGQQVFTSTLRLDRFGTIKADVPLSDAAVIGNYSITVAHGSDLSSYLNVTVAAYRKPEYAVTVATSGGKNDNFVQGQQILASTNARYYFGAPLNGAKVRWDTLVQPFYFAPVGYDDYTFGDYNRYYYPYPLMGVSAGGLATPFRCYGPCGGTSQIIHQQGTGTTDTSGNFSWYIPTTLGKTDPSETFTVEATAIDASGQEVAGRTSVTVHRALFYVGIRSLWNTLGFPLAHKRQNIDLVALSMDGVTRLPQTSITVVASRRLWSETWTRDSQGNQVWHESYVDIPVSRQTVLTDKTGRARVSFVPPSGGNYHVVATAQDSLGHPVESAIDLWVNDVAYVDWGTRTDDGVRVIADRATYAPGDQANLLVAAPAPDMLALVTLERGSVLEHHLVRLHGTAGVIAVPVTLADAPNIFVGVTLFAGTDDPTGKGLPRWRQGYAELHIHSTLGQIHLNITPDKSTYRPEEVSRLRVTTLDPTGHPVAAAVSLAVVDASVLALAAANTTGSYAAFYFERPLGVQTSGTVAVYADRLELGQPYWWCRYCVMPLAAGGFGGAASTPSAAAPQRQFAPLQHAANSAASSAGAKPQPRTYFPDTAYWNPEVLTNNQGQATINLVLPDSLTTWHILGSAVAAQTRVADSDNTLIVAKDLLVRPEWPRFLRSGDRLTLRSVVNNTTARPLPVAVSLSSDPEGHVRLNGASDQQTATVPPNGERTFLWPVHIVGTGSATLLVAVRDRDNRVAPDAVQQVLPVETASFPEIAVQAGATRTVTHHDVVVPPDADLSQGDLTIRLIPSLASGLGPALDYLRSYPYWCAEQTTSHLFPDMVLRHLLPNVRAVKSGDTAELKHALELLESLQQPDGGWGWWYENGSSAFMTAYAMDGLLAARAAGFPVRASVIARGIARLVQIQQSVGLSSLSSQSANAQPGNGTDQDLNDPNVQAYITAILAQVGQPIAQAADQLYTNRNALSAIGLAYLALAYHDSHSQPDRARTLVGLLDAQATVRDGRAWWPQTTSDWQALDSPVRFTAVAVTAISQISPTDARLPLAIRWLMEQRQDDQWQDTQDTAATLVALGYYLAGTGELAQRDKYSVVVNGYTVAAGTLSEVDVVDGITVTVPISAHQIIHVGHNDIAITRTPLVALKASGGWLYDTTTLHYFRRNAYVGSAAHGIVVQRRYVVLHNGKPVKQAHAGDVIRVELAISTTQTLNYVMLEDPYPAGAEPLDGSLLTSSQATQLRNQGDLPSQTSFWDGIESWTWWWYPDHVELRDDRAALFAQWLGPGLYHYSYLLQVLTPGVYRALPAQAMAMYRPEINGRSTGAELSVQ